MSFDIFNPAVSVVTKGLEGKIIFIYGTNRTGKTFNLARADRPFFASFEPGLNAIGGVNHRIITTWDDWKDTVQKITNPATVDKVKEMYKTIVIDAPEVMGELASHEVAALFGADSVGTGNKGYGLWSELALELRKWLRPITNLGMTVAFLGHEGTRKAYNAKGEKYDKVYPRGESRIIDAICDVSDFICYAHVQPNNEKGEAVLSTLYMHGGYAFHAGSRFHDIVPAIPEWNMEKLEKAIHDAVEASEKRTGVKAVSYEEAKEQEAKVYANKWSAIPIKELILLATEKAMAYIEKHSPEDYQEILYAEFGTRDFKLAGASEQQRSIIERLLTILEGKGF